MKKLATVVFGFLVTAGTAQATMNYECWTYLNGHPDKLINVSANSREEAERLAIPRFRDLPAKWDYIRCK